LTGVFRGIVVQDAELKARRTVRLKSPWDKSSAWARVLEDGRIELELYDYSTEAQQHMGNDVAWFYRIGTAQKPRLLERLQKRTGTAIRDDKTLLRALTRSFSHVHAIRDWLKVQGIPYDEEFDSWA
jgi:hypothetical protein